MLSWPTWMVTLVPEPDSAWKEPMELVPLCTRFRRVQSSEICAPPISSLCKKKSGHMREVKNANFALQTRGLAEALFTS